MNRKRLADHRPGRLLPGVVQRGAPLVLGVLLSACATYPVGPSVMALPGSGATFDQFQYDDQQCRAYAQNGSGALSAQQGAEEGAADSAIRACRGTVSASRYTAAALLRQAGQHRNRHETLRAVS